MKSLIFIFLTSITLACNQKENQTNTELPNKKNEKVDELTTKESGNQNQDSHSEVMLEKDILFNGKLSRYFMLEELTSTFADADSIKLLDEEQPCTFIFDTEPQTDNPQDYKYYYKDGSRFEIFKEKVAVDQFKFTKNNYILYKGQRLDNSTRISDLQKIFPNAIKDIATMDVYNEGSLEVIFLSENENNASDGHIRLFIKNDCLYSIHWWFPC